MRAHSTPGKTYTKLMEWQQNHHPSPLDESWYDNVLFSPQFQMQNKSADWTFEENKMFENAIAEVEPGSLAFFEKVATSVPLKTIEQIKDHYQALIEDIEMIESGLYSIPDYQWEACEKDKKGSQHVKRTSNSQQRKRGVPWTEEEHQMFLMGLEKYGKGDWRSISRYYVVSRTPTQVASHAQKYFRRQTSSTPMNRRRPSIHDIQTVNHYQTAFADSALLLQWNGNIVDQINPFLL